MCNQFCPRPSFLDSIVNRKISHLRNKTLAHSIFDYTLGLELHRELSRKDSSLAAGLFVSEIDALPSNLGMVHESRIEDCSPLSWFLASHFVPEGARFSPIGNRLRNRLSGESRKLIRSEDEWAHGIVTGDNEAINRIINQLQDQDEEVIEGPFAFLPHHTITVDVNIGGGYW